MTSHRSATTVVVALLLALLTAPAALAEQAGSELRRFHAGAVDVRGESSCALTPDRRIACWGRYYAPQPGGGIFTTSDEPVLLDGIERATAVAVGSSHACALLMGGSIRCWGVNDDGQLGNGTTDTDGSPVAVTGIGDAVGISAGHAHTCAVMADGTARCWGRNDGGQLGAITPDPDSLVPVAVTGLDDATAVSAGESHTCAVLVDGTARCWGDNFWGRLGDGSNENSTTPVTVSGLADAVGIAAGASHTCAVRAGGGVSCWGYNGYGILADDSIQGSYAPVAIAGVAGAIGVSRGGTHACALLGDGHVSCWGRNHDGQLGRGTTDGDEHLPGDVLDIADAFAVAGSSNDHSCVVHDDRDQGAAACWGENGVGQVGNGTTDTPQSAPDGVTNEFEAVGRVADLSLSVSGPSAPLRTGNAASFTITLRAGGPDDAGEPEVSLEIPSGFTAGTPSAGTLTGGVWELEGLGTEVEETLTITGTSTSPRTVTLTGEITGADLLDPDSDPGDGLPGQDDRVVASLRFDAPPPPADPPADDGADDLGMPIPPPPPPAPPLPPAGAPLPALALSDVAITPRRVRRARGKPTLSFVLSRAATVRILVLRARPGRRSGRRCVKPTRRLRSARRCRRYVRVAALPAARHGTGATAVTLPARLGGRRLGPGRYRITVVATDGAATARRSVAFRVVR